MQAEGSSNTKEHDGNEDRGAYRHGNANLAGPRTDKHTQRLGSRRDNNERCDEQEKLICVRLKAQLLVEVHKTLLLLIYVCVCVCVKKEQSAAEELPSSML